MAKSIRSKIKRTHRAARRSEFAPTRDARQESRGVRMTAYVARSEARRLAAEGKHISDDLAAASAQADLVRLPTLNFFCIMNIPFQYYLSYTTLQFHAYLLHFALSAPDLNFFLDSRSLLALRLCRPFFASYLLCSSTSPTTR
mgnify:CR=1 FL=1